MKRKDKTMNNYTIYGREDCEYCVKAIHLCISKGVSFSFINMTSQAITKEALSQKLNLPVMTVPQVLCNNHYIGGSDALEKHFSA